MASLLAAAVCEGHGRHLYEDIYVMKTFMFNLQKEYDPLGCCVPWATTGWHRPTRL